MVGLGADGASINRGDKAIVKSKFRKDMTWLVFGWCMAHRAWNSGCDEGHLF